MLQVSDVSSVVSDSLLSESQNMVTEQNLEVLEDSSISSGFTGMVVGLL